MGDSRLETEVLVVGALGKAEAEAEAEAMEAPPTYGGSGRGSGRRGGGGDGAGALCTVATGGTLEPLSLSSCESASSLSLSSQLGDASPAEGVGMQPPAAGVGSSVKLLRCVVQAGVGGRGGDVGGSRDGGGWRRAAPPAAASASAASCEGVTSTSRLVLAATAIAAALVPALHRFKVVSERRWAVGLDASLRWEAPQRFRGGGVARSSEAIEGPRGSTVDTVMGSVMWFQC